MFDDRIYDCTLPPEGEDRPGPGPEHPAPPPPPHGPHGPGGPHPGPRHPAPPPPPPHGPHGHHPPPPPPPHGPHGPHIDPERYEKLDTDGKLLALIRALGHAARFHFDERGGQHRALELLRQDEAMTQRELTERLGIQPGSASELIGKLERAGLVTRTPSETDRRTADVRLTEAGLARRQEREEKEKSGGQALFAALDEQEKQTLLELLEKLHQSWRDLPRPEPPAPPAPVPEPAAPPAPPATEA